MRKPSDILNLLILHNARLPVPIHKIQYAGDGPHPGNLCLGNMNENITPEQGLINHFIPIAPFLSYPVQWAVRQKTSSLHPLIHFLLPSRLGIYHKPKLIGTHKKQFSAQ
jgi:hypothetical protein